MIIISPVPYEYVDQFWPLAEKWFSKATRYSKELFSTKDIKASIDNQSTALWIIARDDDEGTEPVTIASFTTRLSPYPNGKGLAIDWVGGSGMDEWLEEFDAILERYARGCGCTHIEAFGRKGWGPVIKRFGYEAVATYRKDLT